MGLFSFLSKINPFEMLLKQLLKIDGVDEQLRALEPGQTLMVDIPDRLDPKIRSKGGKRFSIDRVEIRRLKDRNSDAADPE